MARLFKSFTSVFVLGVFLYFIVNSCTDQNLISTSAKPEKKLTTAATSELLAVATFSSAIGAPIDGATGVRWMKNFISSNKGSVSDYIIPMSILRSILGSASCVGVILYYAVDDSKVLHIIPIGVDGAGKVIGWKSITLGNTIIDWQTAWQWINNYSGTLRSHFFGSKILVSTYLPIKNLRISRAINDAGVPQLLLSDADSSTVLTYGDDSGSCPPFCATN